jgi:hypothetical protein
MTVIYVKRYRYATFGVAGWILLVVEYDGHIYRGTGPFYNAQPEDHVTSEIEDVTSIDKIVRTTLREWSGLATIQNGVITVPLFYDVPEYNRNPKYHSRQGSSFGTLIHLERGTTIPRDIPWRKGEEIYLS